MDKQTMILNLEANLNKLKKEYEAEQLEDHYKEQEEIHKDMIVAFNEVVDAIHKYKTYLDNNSAVCNSCKICNTCNQTTTYDEVAKLCPVWFSNMLENAPLEEVALKAGDMNAKYKN